MGEDESGQSRARLGGPFSRRRSGSQLVVRGRHELTRVGPSRCFSVILDDAAPPHLVCVALLVALGGQGCHDTCWLTRRIEMHRRRTRGERLVPTPRSASHSYP
jgi:hypothetical protein